jgi:hypothetical protein
LNDSIHPLGREERRPRAFACGWQQRVGEAAQEHTVKTARRASGPAKRGTRRLAISAPSPAASKSGSSGRNPSRFDRPARFHKDLLEPVAPHHTPLPSPPVRTAAMDAPRDEQAAPFLAAAGSGERRSHAADAHVLSAAFLFVFSAYSAAQNLQSSVNAVPFPLAFFFLVPILPRPAQLVASIYPRARRRATWAPSRWGSSTPPSRSSPWSRRPWSRGWGPAARSSLAPPATCSSSSPTSSRHGACSVSLACGPPHVWQKHGPCAVECCFGTGPAHHSLLPQTTIA